MALLPIFCVARSSRTDLSMLVARALKIGKIADGGRPPTYETMHYPGIRSSLPNRSRFSSFWLFYFGTSLDGTRSTEEHRLEAYGTLVLRTMELSLKIIF
jgi:hypothetical protein